MKKVIFFCLAMLAISSSCKKDEADDSNAITQDEAAESVGAAFSSDAGGASSFIVQGSSGIDANSYNSLRTASSTIVLKDTTITDTLSNLASTRTFSYKWIFKAELTLALGIPASVVTSHTYSGKFEGPYFKSEHQGNGTSTYTQLGTGTSLSNFVANNTWIMNGTYERSGTETHKINNKVVTSSTQITLSNVSVDRINKKILSGNGTITMQGSNSKGETFSYSGSITFLGDGVATLTIGDKSYTLTLKTGEISAK